MSCVESVYSNHHDMGSTAEDRLYAVLQMPVHHHMLVGSLQNGDSRLLSVIGNSGKAPADQINCRRELH